MADHFRGSEGVDSDGQVPDPSMASGAQSVPPMEDASLADAMNEDMVDVRPVPDPLRQPVPDPYGEAPDTQRTGPQGVSSPAQAAAAIPASQPYRAPEVAPHATGMLSPMATGAIPRPQGPQMTGVIPSRQVAGVTTVQAPIPDTSGLDVSADQNLDYEPHGIYASLVPSDDQVPINRDLDPTISMRHVTKIYPAQPQKPALDDISLDIYPGEFVFIVGHSGSGKSTFLRLLTRELKVTSGEIMVAGQSLTKMRNWKVPFLRRQIGCVFQDFKLLQDRTTYENVAFSLECIGKPKSVIRAQVPEVLRLVGLADKMEMFPDQLSGGEQQRVSVARAMVNRPPLLICDEPTGNLDPAISLGIMKLLDAINKNGTTVIMATHDREMVDSMRKRVVALESGHLVRDQERGGYGFYGSL